MRAHSEQRTYSRRRNDLAGVVAPTVSRAPSLFSHPTRYLIASESQVVADSNPRNLALPDQLVNRSWGNLENLADFLLLSGFGVRWP